MEGSDKSAGGNNGIPPPRLTYTHIPEETENNALYPSTGLPLKPPPPNSPITSNNNNTNGNNNRRDESVPPNGVMYWMRVCFFASFFKSNHFHSIQFIFNIFIISIITKKLFLLFFPQQLFRYITFSTSKKKKPL